jgi:hypothetical protein
MDATKSVTANFNLSGNKYKLYLPLIFNDYHTLITTTAYSSLEDGETINVNCTLAWTDCRNATYSSTAWNSLLSGTVGASYNSGSYTIQRMFFFFDTAAVPPNATITAAKLMVYTGQWQHGSNIAHIVQSNAGIPLSGPDFSRIGSQSGGSATFTPLNSWIPFNLNPTALGWITKGGITRLALIHNKDLNNSTPTEPNDVGVATTEDSIHRPYLVITYFLH